MKHVLELPWGADELKEKHGLKAIKGGYFIYSGVLLPKELRAYTSEDFSYTRWLEDEANAHVSTPTKTASAPPLYPHQEVASTAIANAYTTGEPGFILADKRGTGKKLSALAGVLEIAKLKGLQPNESGGSKAKLLIVTSKSSQAQWRTTLQRYPSLTAFARVLVMPYGQLGKLLMAPPSARIAQKKSTKTRVTSKSGVPTIHWDYIVFDEEHLYKTGVNASTAAAVAKLNKPYKKDHSPFVIYSTPTPGSSPLDFSLMGRLLAPAIAPAAPLPTPNTWGEFLENSGFSVGQGRNGYVWVTPSSAGRTSSNAATRAKYEAGVARALAARKKDSLRLLKALKNSPAIFLHRGYPVLGLEGKTLPLPHPLALRGGSRAIYSDEWTDFRTWMNLNPTEKGYEVKEAIYRKKSELVKIDSTIELVVDLLGSESTQVWLRVGSPDLLDQYLGKIAKKRVALTVVTTPDDLPKLEDFYQGDTRLLVTLPGVITSSPESKAYLRQNPLVVNPDIYSYEALTLEARLLLQPETLLAYLPHGEGTLEEELVEEIKKNNGEALTKKENLEKFFRVRAARQLANGKIS